jgi:Na+/proline symporter
MIDLVIVLAFVVYSVGVGLATRRRASRNLTEYFLAGRSLRGWRAGASMAATQFAADTPLLVTGLIAVGGVFSVWRLWVYALAFLLMGFVLGAAWRRAGVLTDAELTMVRYSAKGALALRALKAVYYGTVINCVVMAFVLVAAVRIFELFLTWHAWLPAPPYEAWLALVGATGLDLSSGITGLPAPIATANNVLSILLMLGFVALYSMTGGLRSVVATDVVQLALMLIGTAAYAWIAVREAGGLAGMSDGLAAAYGPEAAARFVSFTPTGGDALLPFLVILALQWFYQMNSDGTGYLAQRTMACTDDRQARIAGVTFTFLQVVLRSLLWLVIGVALLLVFPYEAGREVTEQLIAERELTFARGMDELLPAGLRGLMLTAMLAALASTLDTHLNWGASYWSNDLYQGVWVQRIRRRQASPRELVLVARLSSLVILALALVIMVNLGSIRTAWEISLLFGAGMGAVLVLRWLWERVNLWCEVSAILVSIVAAPIVILTVETDWVRLALMSGLSTVAVLAAARWSPPTDPAVLEAFYWGVRPPGWWANTARSLGEDPGEPLARLARGIGVVVACVVTVFASLVGFGKLLLQPGSAVPATLLLAAAAGAVPFWIRSLTRSRRDPGAEAPPSPHSPPGTRRTASRS